MNHKLKAYLFVTATIWIFSSCQKHHNDTTTVNYGDTTGTLKSAANGLPIGFGAYQGDADFAKYFSIIAREGTNITPGNEMKHASIVQSDGSLNFTKADALVNLASSAGLGVYGHTLCWHSQQNATYIKTYAGIIVAGATELLSNPGFESGTSGWSIFNTNGATITFPTDGVNAHAGNGYMKVVNPTAQTGNQWKVQVSSASFATIPGQQYIISYWVKAATAGGSIRLSTGPSSAQYQGDQTIGTAWQQVSWTITATLATTTFLFDMGQVANTYYIDDASVKQVVQPPTGAQVTAKVDTAMKQFITGMVTHYKGTVKAWDVVNEALTDAGTIRTSANPGGVAVTSSIFFWSDYPFNGVTKDFALHAFQYAAAADPSALLFINDYNLEYSSKKVDSLVAYVAYLKSKGAKIDGIGTQMHVGINTAPASIDYMFQKLASTGLQIRISELDVACNPYKMSSFLLTPAVLDYQKTMYHKVVASYLKNVPAAQRYGITIWGVNDADSWIAAQSPLLWGTDFAKKPAYSGVIQALKGQ